MPLDADTMVVGASAAGLATAAWLSQAGQSFEILEATDGVPHVSGGPTALPGLFFCGQHVSPAGMLREIGLEARRIARHLAQM